MTYNVIFDPNDSLSVAKPSKTNGKLKGTPYIRPDGYEIIDVLVGDKVFIFPLSKSSIIGVPPLHRRFYKKLQKWFLLINLPSWLKSSLKIR